MAHSKRNVIAITPVKNEAWILNEFIEITLKFADYLLIADQQSTDGSLDIARNKDRVYVVENISSLFDNHARSSLLIREARRLFGRETILIAIDADELFIPSPASFKEWDLIKFMDPGTTLVFDKPTFYGCHTRWIQYGSVFPLGYIDDGTTFHGSLFHSRRIPNKQDGKVYQCRNIAFAHLDSLALSAMLSKRRLYSIREKDAGNVKLSTRWKRNSPRFTRELEKLVTPVSPNVLQSFKKAGIDIQSVQRPQPYWWDIESLRRFKINGTYNYCWDDVWDHQWEELLDEANLLGFDDLPDRIERPNILVSSLRNMYISIFYCAVKLHRLNLKMLYRNILQSLSLRFKSRFPFIN
ncbi:MAG: glycosyltransferase family 2 protein [Opitutales bacterium]|nr:glycosyltransferase family 2 protein [Opitutales bacterium]